MFSLIRKKANDLYVPVKGKSWLVVTSNSESLWWAHHSSLLALLCVRPEQVNTRSSGVFSLCYAVPSLTVTLITSVLCFTVPAVLAICRSN